MCEFAVIINKLWENKNEEISPLISDWIADDEEVIQFCLEIIYMKSY